MTENEFLALGRAGYNRIPLQLETLADLDTPLSIYLKLANRPGSYLLESVIGGERFGRYSIVGLPAREMIQVRGNRVRRLREGAVAEERDAADPLQYIDEYLRAFRARSCASPAASRAISTTTPCATSSPSSGARGSRTPSGFPTSACCSPRSSRWWTTSRASCTSSSTPIPRCPARTARHSRDCRS